MAPLPRARRELLLGPSPAAVLARLAEGDPLSLRARVAARLEEQALLLDAERVLVFALAACSWRAARYRGSPGLGTWLEQRIDEAIEEVAQEVPGSAPSSLAQRLAQVLGTTPAAAARAAARFNARPAGERQAFFALIVRGVGLDELARREGRGLACVARGVRAALEALLIEAPAGAATDGVAPSGAARRVPA